MLLALIIVSLTIYILQQQRPYDYITRREMDALLKKGRERERLEHEEYLRQLKLAENRGQLIPLSESEKEQFILTSANKTIHIHAQWVADLQARHDKGLINDRQFEEAMDRYLDRINQLKQPFGQ
ncbi:hypothetical protein [Runella sp.]|uniref:hypothetical protein n=1 Tax=Runella sp. TaxID=1960881 RepID=UPI003D0E92AB